MTSTSTTTTAAYTVAGLTCDHCVAAVTSELESLAGVRRVEVGLVAGGESTVTVVSDGPLPLNGVAAALDEAGDYTLVRS